MAQSNGPDSSSHGDAAPARSLRRALFVSVAVNLFFVAAVIGLALFGGPRHGHGPEGRGHRGALDRFIQEAPDDLRAAAETVMTELRPRLRAQRQEARQARRALLEALVAEPFDAEAFAAAQARFRAERAAVSVLRDEGLARLAALLPQAERARLAEALRRHRGRRRPRED